MRLTKASIAVVVALGMLAMATGCELEDAGGGAQLESAVAAASGGEQSASGKASGGAASGSRRGSDGKSSERRRAKAQAQRKQQRQAAGRKQGTGDTKAAGAKKAAATKAQGTQRSSAQAACHPSYEGACLDPNASDYDCLGGSGDGPLYTGTVRVVGPDQFGLDRDGDGLGCE